jgi:tRNA A-37 threonylcarbamoyl transferase component Bud32
MGRRTPRWWVLVLGAAYVAYFALLLYCDIRRPEDYGFEADFTSRRMVLSRIVPDRNSPAARAGLQPNDIISVADRRVIRTAADWTLVDEMVEFDRPIALSVVRGGVTLPLALMLRPAPWSYWKTEPGIVLLGVLAVQLAALGFALVIALRRPDDHVAVLGAWALASVAVYTLVSPYRIAAVWRSLPLMAGILLWAPYLSSLAVAAVLFTFFASFPRRLVHSGRVWALLWAPMIAALVLPVRDAVLQIYRGGATAGPLQGELLLAATGIYTMAGLAALVLNYRRLDDVNERRRVKVLVVGAVIGLLPGLLVVASYKLRSHANLSTSIFASRATSLGTLTLLLFPASFAYAIVRHRLFDISVMIRQGVRYAVARGLLASVVPALALLFVADVLLRGDQPLATILKARFWAYGLIAGTAFIAHTRRQQWLRALDRHFFREHYDAQQLLHEVADDIRQVGDFERLAPRVVAQIEAALHPEFVALLVRESSEVKYRSVVAVPAGLAPPPLRVDSKLVALLRVFGKPLEVASGSEAWLKEQLPEDELRLLRECRIELLVPIVTSPGRAESVLTLGVKRSEEPYSQEDRDLLAIIAVNLSLLLDRHPAPPAWANDIVAECPVCGTCWESGRSECPHDAAPLVPGSTPRMLAARYRLERRLGRGGFGTVYSAFDSALDRRVAVKMIREDLLTDAVVAARFQREARLAAAFVHPNVVSVYDFGVSAAARAFLVMELLDGATLREELVRQPRFSAARALAVMRDLCEAMEAAHRRQLLHRDLKPENIFLVSDGVREVGKVLDFGVARAFNEARDLITDGGALVGTLRYMAPAQLRGDAAQAGSDLWALGVIAYEMLAGAHPFAQFATGPFGVMPADYGGALEFALDDAPATWKAFFGRALALDAARRPASPAKLLVELETALR